MKSACGLARESVNPSSYIEPSRFIDRFVEELVAGAGPESLEYSRAFVLSLLGARLPRRVLLVIRDPRGCV